jgi:hypothetical protein
MGDVSPSNLLLLTQNPVTSQTSVPVAAVTESSINSSFPSSSCIIAVMVISLMIWRSMSQMMGMGCREQMMVMMTMGMSIKDQMVMMMETNARVLVSIPGVLKRMICFRSWSQKGWSMRDSRRQLSPCCTQLGLTHPGPACL